MPTRINCSWWRGRERSFRLNLRCGNAQLTSGIFSPVPQGRSCLTEKQASTIEAMTACDGHQTWIPCSLVTIFNQDSWLTPWPHLSLFLGWSCSKCDASITVSLLMLWCTVTKTEPVPQLFYCHTWSGKLDCFASLQAAVSVVLDDIVELVYVSLSFLLPRPSAVTLLQCRVQGCPSLYTGRQACNFPAALVVGCTIDTPVSLLFQI